MLLVFASWIVITCVFLSTGNILISIWNSITKSNDQYSFFDTFWLGLCATGTLLSIISLFSPLNIYILGVFVVLSLIYCFIKKQQVKNRYKSYIKQLSILPIWAKASIGLLFIVVTIYALSTPILFDFGLYHLQSMMWAEEYKVIPGLGNIHGRFGFNSNFLLLSGLLGYQPEIGLQAFTINGLCLFVFSTWIILKVNVAKSLIQKVVLLLLLSVFFLTFVKYSSSTSTDISAHILIIYILLNLVLAWDSVKQRILLFTIIPIFCVTLKLSSAIIVLVTLCTLYFLNKEKSYKSILTIICIGLIIIIPWCTRFVIITGYLIYPLPSIDIFSFDWKMPLQAVVNEKEAAYAWARIAHQKTEVVLAMPFTEWFPIWIQMQAKLDIVLYILAFISPIIIFIKRKTQCYNYRIIGWIIAMCGLIFSFVTAPDPRFGFSFILCSAFLPFLLSNNANKEFKNLNEKASNAISLLFILVLIGFIGLGIRQVKHYHKINDSMLYLVYKPQPVDYMKSEESGVGILYDKHTVQNIIIYSPKANNACFDQCLPCMPYFDNRIELRGNSVEDGFRLKQE